ncbi:hypothetical protein [Oceanobacillus jordanicus]|uniref:Uncharacterized protein n=1 Tax=Oceanobacillus jordanicus TaxID=2867266 RepID=A0AAW5B2X4_9BACI|nr:hypothetical protein [Oceanobacillus jordanicus]MCG3418597.1 hypothetical protein [Oceanobacillus jordanicus]
MLNLLNYEQEGRKEKLEVTNGILLGRSNILVSDRSINIIIYMGTSEKIVENIIIEWNYPHPPINVFFWCRELV